MALTEASLCQSTMALAKAMEATCSKLEEVRIEEAWFAGSRTKVARNSNHRTQTSTCK